MDYERGLEQLKRRLRGTNWEQEFLIYELRLRENLHREQRYGSNEQIRSDRAQIVDQLNCLARRISINFNDLCLNFRISPSASERDRRNKLRERLKEIENAIRGGNYDGAYRDVMNLLKQAAGEMSVQQTARLKYFEALIHLGSGSPKEASSFQVVAMEKEAQASFMHEKRF
jgi:hypothetical protein